MLTIPTIHAIAALCLSATSGYTWDAIHHKELECQKYYIQCLSKQPYLDQCILEKKG